MKTFSLLSIITSSILLSGCGGGGGSSGNGGNSPQPYINVVQQPASPIVPIVQPPETDLPIINNPTDPTPTVPVPTPTVPEPTPTVPDFEPAPTVSYLTQEYYASQALSGIKANVAYENGFTGTGITIAIIDSGINKSHSDLSSKIVNGTSFVGEIYSNGYLYYNQVSFDQLERIDIASSGTSYAVAPNITISGDGTGATAQAILNQDGSVNSIVLTNSGTGYTYANVSIDNSGTGGSGLSIDKIILGGDDLSGHGTFLAGLAAGDKDQLNPTDTYNNSIQGVAYSANIMPIKVFDNDGNGFVSMVHRGVEYAYQNNADVINLSLGSVNPLAITTSSNVSVYKSSLESNSTLVIASGNEGLDCLSSGGSLSGKCSFPAALPWLNGYSDLLNQSGGWIVVGSVDSDNIITSWSNKAGVTKSNYVVAPGKSLVSDSTSGGYTMGSGTSYSTAIVSGAVALMYQKYPHLNGNQISQILFQTSTDLGATGVDDVYGNGLINIEKAFAPIGQLSISPKNAAPTSYVGGLSLGKTFGTVNAQSLNSTIALDSYGRDYQVNIGSNVATNKDANSFNFDNFQIMKIKNLLLGIDETNQRGLIGFNYENTSLLFSQTDDLFGTNSAGLFGLENEKTNYFSLRQQIDFFGITSGFNFDYAYGNAKSAENSLINNIDTLSGYGYALFLEKNDIGLTYRKDIAISNGGFNFNIPTSRNLDGSLNYNNVAINDFGISQEEVGIYYKFNTNKFNLYTGVTKKLHKELLYEENENLAYLNMRYFFNKN